MKKIYIYEEIDSYWGYGASQLKWELGEGSDDVEIHLNSPGGSVFEGIAIYNMLKAYEGKVKVIVDGIAASIASIIALGGDELEMKSGTFLMIHNPWMMAVGEAEDLRKQADFMDKSKEQLIDIYLEKMPLSKDEISAMMDKETWINAEEAKALGLIAEVVDAPRLAASINMRSGRKLFNTIPEGVKMHQQVEAQEVEQEIEQEVAEVEATATEPQAEDTAPQVEETAPVGEVEAPELYTAEQVQEAVQAALRAEEERQDQIKALAFEGQEALVAELIKDKVSVQDATQRIIFNLKESGLSLKQDANQLHAFLGGAPESLADHQDHTDTASEISRLRAAWEKETSLKKKTEIIKQINQLKKGA